MSIGWLAASSAVCLYLGSRLARGLPEAVPFLAGTAGVFAYEAPGEHALWKPLASLAAAMVLAISAAAFARPGSAG